LGLWNYHVELSPLISSAAYVVGEQGAFRYQRERRGQAGDNENQYSSLYDDVLKPKETEFNAQLRAFGAEHMVWR